MVAVLCVCVCVCGKVVFKKRKLSLKLSLNKKTERRFPKKASSPKLEARTVISVCSTEHAFFAVQHRPGSQRSCSVREG